MGMHMWGNMGGMWGGGAGFLGMALMFLWWALVVVGVFFLVRMLMGRLPGRGDDPDDRALRILRERYARGEIQSEEFEQKKRELTR
ncbi:MAG: SHOCT domain-containing protein [Burkholderiaceae bacterium]|nr:SHOCT domain-containing protein [Burkholderiaceae bacterium]